MGTHHLSSMLPIPFGIQFFSEMRLCVSITLLPEKGLSH
jgi:hypothetical protein